MTTTAFDWTAVAPAWEQHRERAGRGTEPVAARVLQLLDLQPGERVVELGSGTGDLALRLAEQVGPAGSLLATDVADGMVAVSARTLAGVPHATTARADAAATGLPDEGFDALVFVMGLMFVREQERAAQELRRVLRPGGRAVVATWAGPDRNPWLAGVGLAAMANGLTAGGPPTEPGGLFSLAAPERLEAVLRAGGFTDVTVEPVEATMRYAGVDEWFDTVSALSGPLAAAFAARPDAMDAVRATASAFATPHLSDDGLALPGLAYVARATR